MATFQKTLMDEFDALHRQALARKQYEASFIYSIAENQANNCHGYPPQKLVSHVRLTVRPTEGEEPDNESLRAYQGVTEVLDFYEELWKEQGVWH